MFQKDRCFLIAEVALAHDGSLGLAHAFIDTAAECGVDAVKFQTHMAEFESSEHEPWRVKFSLQDEARYDYWKRTSFTEAQWHGLKKHADEKGLKFLSTPFSPEAMDLLSRVGVCAWKIASGEVTNLPMVRKMAKSGLPVLLSSGMSSIEETDAAVKELKSTNSQFAVLQCTSSYPSPAEKIGLNMLSFYRERYGCAVGLSDHSGKIFPGLAAVSLGNCSFLEVHLTLSRKMFGPDVSSSLTPDELKQLSEGVRFIETMHAHPVDKDMAAADLAKMRKIFGKSLFAKKDIPQGAKLEESYLAAKKPGTGVPVEEWDKSLGRTVNRSIKAGEMIMKEDLE